jgi:hypothetical protein
MARRRDPQLFVASVLLTSLSWVNAPAEERCYGRDF